MTTIMAIVIVLSGLIFFHELGHFAVARCFGMGVSVFSLGFGPKLFKYKPGKTEYALSLMPLGGYVALVGESNEEDIPEGFCRKESFSLRPAWQRLLVVAAGPVANLLLAWLLCWTLAFVWGESVLLPEIGAVGEQSPAAAAGLKAGDRILSIDDVSVQSWQEMSDAIALSEGRTLRFETARPTSSVAESDSGQSMREAFTRLTFDVTPVKSVRKSIFGEDETTWLVGVRAAGTMVTRSLSLLAAAPASAAQAWQMISLTGQSFVKLAQRVVPLNQVGGPIMIMQLVSEQTHQGLAGLLALTALISVNLGVLNLLPIPVLDGGQIVFFLWELLFRRPVNGKVQTYAMRAGIALLVCLMLLATLNDVWRLLKNGG